MMLAAVALGVVFLVSGALKARDPSWPDAARTLGTPQFVVPLVAPLELVLGALLFVGVARRFTAVVALGLLVVFTGVLVRAIRSGNSPVCACFGSFSAKPVGRGSVFRNGGLIALAILAAT